MPLSSSSSPSPLALNLLRPHGERGGSYRFHGSQRSLSAEVTDGACVHVLFFIAPHQLFNDSDARVHINSSLRSTKTPNVLTHRCLGSPRPAARTQTNAQRASTAWKSISAITASCEMSVSFKADVMHHKLWAPYIPSLVI